MKALTTALREARQQHDSYVVRREAFDAKVMHSDLVYMMATEDSVDHDTEILGTKGMNKAHAVIRGSQGRDRAIENAFRVAHNDFASQRSQQQRQERLDYRAAKKAAARLR